jgi:hypothetical protein
MYVDGGDSQDGHRGDRQRAYARVAYESHARRSRVFWRAGTAWIGLAARAGTPEAIVKRWNESIGRSVTSASANSKGDIAGRRFELMARERDRDSLTTHNENQGSRANALDVQAGKPLAAFEHALRSNMPTAALRRWLLFEVLPFCREGHNLKIRRLRRCRRDLLILVTQLRVRFA